MEENNNTRCPHCGGKRFEEGIAISLQNEVGNVGPHFKVNFLMANVAQMYCDLCLDCGELVRFYIKDKTDKNWIKRSGQIGGK